MNDFVLSKTHKMPNIRWLTAGLSWNFIFRIFLSGITVMLFLINSLELFNKNYSIREDPLYKWQNPPMVSGFKNISKIVIDAGHGGKDPGCNVAGTVFEKNIALDIALRFGKYLEDSIPELKVIYTRKKDVFLELYQRAALANSVNADVFVSVHCNANPSSKHHGFETYIMGTHKTAANLEVSKRENESILLEKDYQKNTEYGGFDPNSPESEIIFSLFQNAFMDQSARLAARFHEAIHSRNVLHTKEVKQAGFLVLWKTAMPSVLVETGFLTNPTDQKLLRSEKGRDEIAHSMFIGFRNYRNWYAKQ